MPKEKPIEQFIAEKLESARWPGVEYDVKQGKVTCSNGVVLKKIGDYYHLHFMAYIRDTRTFNTPASYLKIVFPEDFDIKGYLYFKYTGNYKLSHQAQLNKIINPFGKKIEGIKITIETREARKYGTTLLLDRNTFTNAMNDAKFIFTQSKAYKNSTENYLAKLKSEKYNKRTKAKTTHSKQGEFRFLVDKLHLATKKNKRDYEKFLNSEDLDSLEDLFKELLRFEVFSDAFTHLLNEYFIRERLDDIINIGNEILNLGVVDLSSAKAQKVINKLGSGDAKKLEGLWQKYFEKYLLYLIFTYKKIFPKVNLEDIEGDKKYPDFIGINHYNGVDIIEIKTHLTNALVWDSSHKNFYFSSEMSKAIVQTKNYMGAITQKRFEKEEDQKNITRFIDAENLYHPRGIIIISSEQKLTRKKDENEKLKRDFTKLRNSLNDIEILTFDEVLNIASEYLKNIIPTYEK